ncbi:hypothetical protein [Schleiferia thermophila]|uniref:hypothetical protein n=1 Tax=Schleiferia thermophila TaxID=884107 RepID=UPI003EE98E0E
MKKIIPVAFLHLLTGILSPVLYLNGFYAIGLFLFSISPVVLVWLVYLVLSDKSFTASTTYNNQWYQDSADLKFSYTSEWEESK